MISLDGNKVLIVDRNLAELNDFKQILQRYNMVVLTAKTPEIALRYIRENEDMRLVLIDFEIDSTLDGAELASIILTRREVPIIFLSKDSSVEMLKKVEELTTYGYIQKGTSETIMMAGIKMALKLFREKKHLDESESLYKSLFVHYPKPLWIYDRDTLNFLMVNMAAIEKYGYSEQEFMRMKITDIRPLEDVKKVKDFIRHAPRNSKLRLAGQWVHLTKNGEPLEVKIVSHPILWFGKDARMVLALDVNDTSILDSSLEFLIED